MREITWIVAYEEFDDNLNSIAKVKEVTPDFRQRHYNEEMAKVYLQRHNSDKNVTIKRVTIKK